MVGKISKKKGKKIKHSSYHDEEATTEQLAKHIHEV